MVSISDYKDASGKIDWDSYRAAERVERQADIDRGRYCYRCKAYIIFGGKGYKQLCYDCEQFDSNTDDITNPNFVRCPKCRHRMSIEDNELYDLYQDGEHQVTCSHCTHDFEVSTSVSYSFRSPALLDEDAESDEDEDDEDEDDEDEDDKDDA
jgi:hypothetical protein